MDFENEKKTEETPKDGFQKEQREFRPGRSPRPRIHTGQRPAWPMSVLPTIMTMMRAVSVRKVLAQVCRVAHPSVLASVRVRADISSVKAVINHVSSALHTVLHVRVGIARIVRAVIILRGKAAISHVPKENTVSSHAAATVSSVLPTVLPVRADTMPMPSRVVTTSTTSRDVPLTVPPLHTIRRNVLLDMIRMRSTA